MRRRRQLTMHLTDTIGDILAYKFWNRVLGQDVKNTLWDKLIEKDMLKAGIVVELRKSK